MNWPRLGMNVLTSDRFPFQLTFLVDALLARQGVEYVLR
jgi:hypothetical protein